MGIGASVFLIAFGAILTFAIRDTTLGGWVDVNVVGWVMMIAGVVGLVATMFIWGGRRRTVVTDAPTGTTYERRSVDDDLV